MKTEILIIKTPQQAQAVQKAADLLDDGNIVAIPTETVYGLGCKLERAALKQLDELKDRSADKRYTLHIGNLSQLTTYIPAMDARSRKLVQNGWPGPLTVVFELNEKALEQVRRTFPKELCQLLYVDGSLGVRYPDNPVTCAILSRSRFPIVAPSANPAAEEPAASVKQVLDYFDGRIRCVIDTPAHGCTYNQSSTVVKIGHSGIKILRKGVISESQIRQWSAYRILFVCTGNTCRSPMAEGFCRKYFSDKLGCTVDHLANFGYIINSAGIAAFDGMPASRHAEDVCRQQHIDLSSHRSSTLTPQDVEQSDVIFTMTKSHRESIIRMFPSSAQKCFMLAGSADIPDPVGMDIEVYRRCFRQIQDNIIGKLDAYL